MRASVRRLWGMVASAPNAMQLAGSGSIAVGLWEVYPPAALIVAGVALVLIGEGWNGGREE